ncbi:MAG: hypothetical protein KBC22_00030 [Candidatus Pacebacteria bacterium]|nr:hypothetical protein [Candidatus Paceibacterota bacterium]
MEQHESPFSNIEQKVTKLESFLQSEIARDYPGVQVSLQHDSALNKFRFSFSRKNIPHYQGNLSFDSFEKIEEFILEKRYKPLIDIAEQSLRDTYNINDGDISPN